MNRRESSARFAVGLMAMSLAANAVHAQSPLVATTLGKTPGTYATQTPPVDNADVQFSLWDTDHNGMLTPNEFRAGWYQLQAKAELHRLHEQFVAMDSDKNGCLSATEYAHLTLVQRAGKSAPSISMFDTQKKQCLDFKAYVAVINYMLKHEQH